MKLRFFLVCLVCMSTSVSAADKEGQTEPLGHGYTRQGEFIYFDGQRIDQAGREDFARFTRVLGYSPKMCVKLDATSFKALSLEYTKDKNMVYYRWISPGKFWVVEVDEADAASFEVIGFNLARDKNNVWWYGRILPGADPATTQIVHEGYVWKDKNKVWYQHQPIVAADPKTFRHVGAGYYIDAKGAYWSGDLIDDADPETFKVLGGNSFVAVDRTSVYCSGQRQPHLDAGSCKFILHAPHGYQVISDKNGVYLSSLKFLHADPDDFVMIDKLTGRGGEYVFLVDTWHCTPVTVYRKNGRLVAETVLYERGTLNALAIIKAEVGEDDTTLKNLKLLPPPGKDVVGKVARWQIEIFEREDMIKRMKEAGTLLK
jgi:hypothetical protein